MEKMSDAAHGDEIEVYLKDHYAGGIGALEMLEHSIESHAGTPLAAFFAELHGDIKADHDQLYNLMAALDVADSGRGWRRNSVGRSLASPVVMVPASACFRPWRASLSASRGSACFGAPCT